MLSNIPGSATVTWLQGQLKSAACWYLRTKQAGVEDMREHVHPIHQPAQLTTNQGAVIRKPLGHSFHNRMVSNVCPMQRDHSASNPEIGKSSQRVWKQVARSGRYDISLSTSDEAHHQGQKHQMSL